MTRQTISQIRESVELHKIDPVDEKLLALVRENNEGIRLASEEVKRLLNTCKEGEAVYLYCPETDNSWGGWNIVTPDDVTMRAGSNVFDFSRLSVRKFEGQFIRESV